MARPKSKIQRKQTGLRLQNNILKAMRHLQVDLERPLNDLFEEAAQDLLKKYGRDLTGDKIQGGHIDSTI